MYYITFINQQGTKVELTYDSPYIWNKMVQKMKRSKVITYIGSGKY